MNIAILHPQCRTKGGAIKMALLSAQSLQKQGHRVMFYTFEHDSDCFPELQEGLTIVTARTTQKKNKEEIIKNKAGSIPVIPDKDVVREVESAPVILNGRHPEINKYTLLIQDQDPGKKASIPSKGMKGDSLDSVSKHGMTDTVDTVDTPRSFWQILYTAFPRFSSSIGIAWDIRQVDIIIAHNPPMQIVGALAKIFSIFSRYHQRLTVIWWHHHVPWYYEAKNKEEIIKNKEGIVGSGKHKNIALALLEGIFHLFSAKTWKSWFERYYVIPHIKYMVATSHYTAFCLEKYCKRKAMVIHPVMTESGLGSAESPDSGIQNTKDKIQSEGIIGSDNNQRSTINDQQSLTLFSHGRLEPGKGFDTLVKVWRELNNKEEIIKNKAGIKLLIAGEGSLKPWLIEQGVMVVPYHEGLLDEIQNTKYKVQNGETIQNTKDKIQNGETIQNTKYKVHNEGIGLQHAPVIPAKDVVREVESRGEQTIPLQGTSGGVDLDPGSRTASASLARDDGTYDTLAIYLSTIDAFGMCPLEAQIAGLPTIILDKGGARETVLLDNLGEPKAQLAQSEKEISEAITYFIQHRSLQKRVSNVNFCHHTEYFSPSRLDADLYSLIDSLG